MGFMKKRYLWTI